MKTIILIQYSNGRIAVLNKNMKGVFEGQTIVMEKTVEIEDEIVKNYFLNPENFIVDVEKGTISAKP